MKNIIAVSSVKGGVGKSSTAVNLALALAAEGAKVSILDADTPRPINPYHAGRRKSASNFAGRYPYGTDLCLMARQLIPIGLSGDRRQCDGVAWPIGEQGVNANVAGNLVAGSRLSGARYAAGTGDIQLTLAQNIPVTGAVVVTTLQDIALIDAKKAL